MIEYGTKNVALVIFSSGRGDSIITSNWLDREDCYLCIPEDQDHLYKPSRLQRILHPANIDKLYLKIEWVWNYFRGKADCVIKIDDDIGHIRDNGTYYFSDKNILKASKVPVDDFIITLCNMFLLAQDLGAPLFGFGNLNRYNYYSQNQRFAFLKAFDSSILGYILEDKIKVDHSIKVKNEYDLQLQCIYHYGKTLVDNRFRQIQDNMFNQSGGMAKYRNSETILESKMVLENKWGHRINIRDRSVSFNF